MKRCGRVTLEATLEQATVALQQLMAQLQPFGSAEDREAVELGAAEVLSNIVRHGYSGGPGVIRMTWNAVPQRVEIRVCDGGRPIPGGALREAANTSFDFEGTDVADLPEGGFGLALVCQVFDEVRYRSRRGVNRLVAARQLH